MPFSHHRTVRFADTDAAGVVFFARTLAICHEACA
jgi:1,4-dihydroxy-2-naphthoyl-CoA hydrolase